MSSDQGAQKQVVVGRPWRASLDGAYLDAFRMKITNSLPDREATSGGPESPGALLERLKKLTR